MIQKKLRIVIRAASVLMIAMSFLSVPSAAADHQDIHLVGDDVIDTPVEEHGSHDDQHGGPGGHLSPSSLNVDLIGQVTVHDARAGLISDVGVLGNFAYLGQFSPGCTPDGGGGVYIIDMADPTNPVEIGFIATPGTHVGEGVQVISVNTKSFKGDLLVVNGESCGSITNRIGGFSLYDVTDPYNPVTLVENFGDFRSVGGVNRANQIHSAFAWQQDQKAYVVIVDDEEAQDVDIFDITNPSNPVMIAEVGLPNWPGAQNSQSAGIGNFRASFFHDVVVKKIQNNWMMLLSYWDAGYITLNMNNPAAPVFVNDSDFTDPDPETGFSPPEGNGHQAEWSHNNRYILATDEDFSPFRTTVGVTSGPFAGSNFLATQGNAVPQITPDSSLSGPTYFVGFGCNTSPPPTAPVSGAIAVVERGGCTFTEKVTNVQNAGYAAGIVFNSAAPGNCEAIVTMAASGNIPFLFVSRSHGFAILGITGYNPANCPSGSNPPLPAPGTPGSTVNLS
ncbi:MAG TPA: PA domain-containing protein, partial [Anaerolineales bacterium]|nr:PA domain-containing protein [Anaerolineales bacterium]